MSSWINSSNSIQSSPKDVFLDFFVNLINIEFPSPNNENVLLVVHFLTNQKQIQFNPIRKVELDRSFFFVKTDPKHVVEHLPVQQHRKHSTAQHSAISPHKAAKQVRADQRATTQASRQSWRESAHVVQHLPGTQHAEFSKRKKKSKSTRAFRGS